MCLFVFCLSFMLFVEWIVFCHMRFCRLIHAGLPIKWIWWLPPFLELKPHTFNVLKYRLVRVPFMLTLLSTHPGRLPVRQEAGRLSRMNTCIRLLLQTHLFVSFFFHLKSLSDIIYCLSGIVGKHQRDALWSVYKYVPLVPCEATINMSHFHLSTAVLLDCGIVKSRSLTPLKCSRSMFRIMFNGIFKVTLWCCWVSAASSLQTENNLTEVWNKSGHQGNYWNRAEVPLRQLRNFEVIFVGIRRRDVSGGAALDDLEYIDCAPSKWYT